MLIRSVLLLMIQAAAALNPIVPGVGQADPHVRVYNDSFYLYATSDFSINNTGFKNEKWWVWKSSDLVDWTLASTLYPNATPASPNEYNTCWATDGIEKDGLYYFFLSLGSEEIGVMQSSSPVGPWENVLKKPLVNQSYGSYLQTEARDPGAFIDDDGNPYLIFGTFNYYIAKLSNDLLSFADEPRNITIVNATSQNGVGILDYKPYLHKRGKTYILSYGAFYSISSNIYGPYEYIGTWIDKNRIEPAFRTNVTNKNPCWCQDEDYNDRHGSFFSYNNQDFWSSNDRSHSGDVYNTNAFRDTILTYVHYFDNYTIDAVYINSNGVGEYKGSQLIEAENYMRSSTMKPKGHNEFGDVFYVNGETDGEFYYPNIRDVSLNASLVFLSSHSGIANCLLYVYTNDLLRCQVLLTAQNDWKEETCINSQDFQNIMSKVKEEGEDVNLVLRFGENCHGTKIDSFKFKD